MELQQAVVEGVARHAVPGVGITNMVLERLCHRMCSSEFKGVYSADYIPKKLAARPRFVIVINLGRRRGQRGILPTGHFVTLAAFPSHIIYVDSFGLPPMQPDVITFLNLCNREVRVNWRKIQDLSSAYCGFYALLFACYFDRIFWRKKNPKLRFGRTRLKKNDQLCLSYLKEMLYS